MRKYLLAIVGLVLLCLLAALGTASGSPDTITVDSTTDVLDADVDCDHVGIGDLPGSDGVTSLREAICAANNNAGSDTIAFSIPATDTGYEVSGISGTWTIPLTSSLPILTGGGTVISGTTQGDLNPDGPEIEISGAGVGSGNCLQVASAGNVIHGLVINRCPWSGVALMGSGATTNTVSGNYIGTDASGSTDLPNGWVGVGILDGAQGNVVGGDTPEERNVISGNDQDGVTIFFSGSMSNSVSGNYIGTDATGAQGLGNGNHGVAIYGGAQNNTVGGDTEGERNIISDNGIDGVNIQGGTGSNTISGNFIGTVVSGTQALGNDGRGVRIVSSPNNTIGGDTAGERNVISGNSTGVTIVGSAAMSNTVSGNYIGTDASGSTDLPNTSIGVQIRGGAQGNVVGGDTPEERNVISGNGQYGVTINDSTTMSNTLSGNYIGTDATGAQDLGNAEHGVAIYDGAQNNTVGGDTEGERNIISGNGMDGVSIQGVGTRNNTISGNFIGTVVTGTQALGNASRGVRIVSSPNNTIGGDTAGERNVISGNDLGVSILGSDAMSNTVSGNYIGTDASGSSDLRNLFSGVQIMSGAHNNTVGGRTEGERNVISANRAGVSIVGSGTMSNTISGNYIGTDATGTQELCNRYGGVRIEGGAQNNTIGGQTAADRNVISGNSWSGVYIKDAGTDGNTVSQNYIGTDVTGTQDKGNSYDGVRIATGAENNTIGPDNLIAHNDLRGVYVDDSGTTGNTITQNSIHSNGLLGIDLNDGGNTELPPPAISGASCITITGSTLITTTVELFTSPDDEGKTYLTTVSPDGSGNWSASGFLADHAYLTATATDAAGNTSEFSAIAACSHTYVPLVLKRY